MELLNDRYLQKYSKRFDFAIDAKTIKTDCFQIYTIKIVKFKEIQEGPLHWKPSKKPQLKHLL